METPRIAFCITCKGRAPHVKLTLPKNLMDNASYPNAVFVLLDYGSPDDLLPYLATHHAKDIAEQRLVVYSLQGVDTFRMAHAKNVAHRCGLLESADILVNLDADNYTGIGFASYIAAQFAIHGPRSFLAMGKMRPGITPRGISGRIVVPKGAFLNAGGYDERFNTWSPDDKDFNLRLRRLGYAVHIIDDRFLTCVRHNDRMRFREYTHAQGAPVVDSGDWDLAESDTTIANFGRVGEGRLFRNWQVGPVAFDPLATRIFGVGMHKTGTTSLHHALVSLGIESAHWPSAHWARRVWMEITTTGRSLALEKYYAACDLPISLLYRELDAAYPGSRFVLTIRDPAEWLESVRRHWLPEFNPFRAQWESDPFTHKVHTLIYGRRKFCGDTFLARYHQHNEEVQEYFRNRPQDLLVLRVDENTSFRKLCDFLDKPVPLIPYPMANRVSN